MTLQTPRSFNAWLRSQLKEKKMSQRQLALQSGVDHSTISRLIKGDRMPSLGTATRLADIPGLLGKTGTAEYGDNSSAHGWFIGIQDDLAFAVFVADATWTLIARTLRGRQCLGVAFSRLQSNIRPSIHGLILVEPIRLAFGRHGTGLNRLFVRA